MIKLQIQNHFGKKISNKYTPCVLKKNVDLHRVFSNVLRLNIQVIVYSLWPKSSQ